jgi:hypothetical protein
LEGRNDERQELPTAHTAECACNGVACRAEADVLYPRPSGVAADDPGDELENDVDDGC